MVRKHKKLKSKKITYLQFNTSLELKNPMLLTTTTLSLSGLSRICETSIFLTSPLNPKSIPLTTPLLCQRKIHRLNTIIAGPHGKFTRTNEYKKIEQGNDHK
jgi:hypothetical protein